MKKYRYAFISKGSICVVDNGVQFSPYLMQTQCCLHMYTPLSGTCNLCSLY